MMNGILLSHGLDAINIPAKQKLAFNQNMLAFYDSQEANQMMAFLVDLQPKN